METGRSIIVARVWSACPWPSMVWSLTSDNGVMQDFGHN